MANIQGTSRRAHSAATKPRACIVRYQPLDGSSIREAVALAEAGFDVEVLCLRDEGEPRWEDLGSYRVRRLSLGKLRGSKLRYLFEYAAWFMFGFVWLTARHLRRRWTLIQVSTLPDIQTFATIIPRLLGAKVVVFLKEPTGELFEAIYGPSRMKAILNKISSLAIRYSHLAFAVSEQHRELYLNRGIKPEDIVAVVNCMPLEPLGVTAADRSSKTDSGQFAVVCHGTIEPRCGHETIIRAVAIARERLPQLRLIVTGRGGYVDEMLALVAELGVSDIVDYRGFVPAHDLGRLLVTADAGISTQQESDYSHVVHTTKMYELLGLGVPVITNRLRANEAYFRENEVLFVRPDDPEDLARALIQLATDPEAARIQAEAGLHAYERYRWERESEKYVGAIEAIL